MLRRTSFFVLLTVGIFPILHQNAPRRTTSLHRSLEDQSLAGLVVLLWTLGYRLPHKNRQTGAELRGRLQKLGLFRESGRVHFNGSVVIPVFNLAGEVVEMYGRKITRGLRENTPLHLYLPGPRRARIYVTFGKEFS